MEKYLHRITDELLKQNLRAFGGVLIEGVKGCGKTTSAKQIAKSSIEFQDEEQRESYLALAKDHPSELLKGERPRLFDEWQDAPKIWGAIRKSIDDEQLIGAYILTGSSSNIIKTPHTGTLRISRMKMYPMSLYESGDSNGAVSLIDLFNKNDFVQIKKEKGSLNTYLYLKTHKEGYNSTSCIYLFSKAGYLSSVEALRFYYLNIISQLKRENKILFSSVITAGVMPNNTALKKLILNSYFAENKGMKGIAVGLVLSDGDGLFSMVEQYERLHFNIYDMNYLGSSSAFPVSSLLSTFALDDSILRCLKLYYTEANINQTIDFHDYNLGLYLYQDDKNMTFVSDEVLGELNYIDLSYLDYQEIWVNRYSGYYGNFFQILKCFGANFNFLKIIFLLFQIIGMMLEFIYPALSTMVIYAIFYEAFDTYDYRVASFFTMIYICMLTASGMCSLVSKNPQELRMANLFLYIFMEVYYAFVLICSIVAMDNINKNRNNDEYKFNKAAISCIIIFTFIPYIIPMLINFSTITSKFVNLLTYIGLGASCSSSNFLIAQIWNASDTSGGNQLEERKSIVLIIFFLYNLFFGFLTAYNYTRRRRANCVMGLGILFLIYNFMRTLAIIGKIIGGKNSIDSTLYSKIID